MKMNMQKDCLYLLSHSDYESYWPTVLVGREMSDDDFRALLGATIRKSTEELLASVKSGLINTWEIVDRTISHLENEGFCRAHYRSTIGIGGSFLSCEDDMTENLPKLLGKDTSSRLALHNTNVERSLRRKTGVIVCWSCDSDIPNGTGKDYTTKDDITHVVCCDCSLSLGEREIDV